jgi:hypothetical protein
MKHADVCAYCGLTTTNRDRYRAHVPCPAAAGYLPLATPRSERWTISMADGDGELG